MHIKVLYICMKVHWPLLEIVVQRTKLLVMPKILFVGQNLHRFGFCNNPKTNQLLLAQCHLLQDC
jgi:hypothetical protein